MLRAHLWAKLERFVENEKACPSFWPYSMPKLSAWVVCLESRGRRQGGLPGMIDLSQAWMAEMQRDISDKVQASGGQGKPFAMSEK